MLEFLCPSCNKRLKVPPAAAGKNATCKACGHRLVVPRDCDAAYREPALTTEHHASSSAIAALSRQLRSRDEYDRWRAIDALGKCGPLPETVVRELAGFLSGRVGAHRIAAAVALGHVGSPAKFAIPALMDARESSNVDLRRAACLALAKISPELQLPQEVDLPPETTPQPCPSPAIVESAIVDTCSGLSHTKIQSTTPSLRTDSEAPARTVDRKLPDELRAASAHLAYTCFGISLFGILGGAMLLFSDPPHGIGISDTQVNAAQAARAWGWAAITVGAIWIVIGALVKSQIRLGVYGAASFALINLLGFFSQLLHGLDVRVVAGMLLHLAVLSHVDTIRTLWKRGRWDLLGRPDVQMHLDRQDLKSLLTMLANGSTNDQRAAMQAIRSMGADAQPAVPYLIEAVTSGSPPDSPKSDLCANCGRRVTLWNRSFGSDICGKCKNDLQAIRHQRGLPPSLAQLAAEALGGIGPAAESAVPALLHARHSRDRRLHEAANCALSHICPRGNANNTGALGAKSLRT